MTRQFADFDALAGHFAAVADALPAAEERILGFAGEAVQRVAKAKIGTYQSGWAPLASSTVVEKTRLGYAPPDNPLLRDGDLRDSIGFIVTPPAVTIGSASQVARWQELGTSRMSPRSFLGPAMIECEPVIRSVIADGVAAVFRGA